jgi:hypothetical protein
MIIYILILHYLIYRQHMRQRRHETLTLATVRALQLLMASRLVEGQRSPTPIDPEDSEDPTESYN